MAEQSLPGGRIPAPPGTRMAPQNSPLVILVAIGLVVVTLAVLIGFAKRSSELAPDYLSEVVLYALSAACLIMLLALGFLLARNVIKLIVERRRAVPFARFRAKLVAALVGMTLIPSVLVLIVGSEVIRSSTERWFSAPIDDVLTSANAIARSVYQEQQQVVEERAGRLAALLAQVDLDVTDEATIRELVEAEEVAGGAGVIDVYRVTVDATGGITTSRFVEVAAVLLPPGYSQTSADTLAAGIAAGSVETGGVEPLGDGAELLCGAAVIRRTADDPVAGVVVASSALSGDLTRHARRINGAYEAYNQLRVLTRPVAGVYLSFFLMTTLMILIAATWLGIYVAKRIGRPVQLLADGARRIGTGYLDHRIEPESSDEFGAMVEAFNTMAEDLSASQRKLVRSRGTSSTRPARRSAGDATSRPSWSGSPPVWSRSTRQVVSAPSMLRPPGCWTSTRRWSGSRPLPCSNGRTSHRSGRCSWRRAAGRWPARRRRWRWRGAAGHVILPSPRRVCRANTDWTAS